MDRQNLVDWAQRALYMNVTDDPLWYFHSIYNPNQNNYEVNISEKLIKYEKNIQGRFTLGMKPRPNEGVGRSLFQNMYFFISAIQ